MRRISFLIVLALAAVSLSAQNRQNQPTFRSGAAYIRVDMYATRDGKPIEDIQENEVEVLEDGVPQKIEAFEHVRVRTGIPQELRVEPKGVEESRQMAADPRARVFVIFLDTYHTQIEGSARMREPLMNFIDRVLGPDDMVAVMTPEMAATEITFQRKTTVISRMLEREWLWGRRGRLPGADNDEKEDQYDACYPDAFSTVGIAKEMKARRREKLTLDALEDLMVHLNGIREERKAVLAVTEGWVIYRPDTKLARALDGNDTGLRPGDVLLRPPRPQPSDKGQLQGSARVQCEADRMSLAALDHEFRLQNLTQTANRGNVTFYPVYARGLVAFDAPIGPERPPSPTQDAANLRNRQEGLRFLAADTDGTSVINTNNIDGALRRIVDDLSSYYLMGYYTTNTKLDGRFRSITVRVKRPGVTVRARKGYRGYTTEELARGGVSPAALEAGGASATGATTAPVAPPVVSFNARAQFRIRAAAWSRAGLSGGTVWIVGELDAQTKRLPAWSRGAQAEIVVTGSDNVQVASQRLELKPGDSPFMLQLPDAGGMQSGDYTVRVRLRSPVEGELGLIDTARISVKSPPSLGEAVMWRRGPTTGPQHLRTADPRFQRSERLRFELATSSAEPASARVVDRNGQTISVPVEVSTRPDPAGFTWVVVDLGLAPFGPADYAVDVTQGQMRQMTAFRVVP
ncbi:MAG TPA: VWA domain-containing protein [Vicinamibacterales bacterium]